MVQNAKNVPADAFAYVTASYAPDFERCRLLCESMDRHVTGLSRHYILVAHADVALFRQLESQRRVVIDERDILPSWLYDVSDPLSLFRRRIWLSLKVPPLRGWHVQQLRRIGIAAQVDAENLIYCDSDVVFFRKTDSALFSRAGKTRLFRRDNALTRPELAEQRIWSKNAGEALGVGSVSGHDYIATLIAWSRQAVIGMTRHIENLSGRHWAQAVAKDRRFSECMLYGRYVDDVLGGGNHFHDSTELCRTYWTGPHLGEAELQNFIDTAESGQVALGLQSFIGTDLALIRKLAAV